MSGDTSEFCFVDHGQVHDSFPARRDVVALAVFRQFLAAFQTGDVPAVLRCAGAEPQNTVKIAAELG